VIATTINNKGNSLECGICAKRFRQNNHIQLREHIIKVHKKLENPWKTFTHKNKRFQCKLCNKQFKYKKELQTHIKAVHDYMAKYVKYNLSNHSKNRHENIAKQFECNLCSDQFGQYRNFQMHFKNVHEKPLLMHKDDCSPPCFHFNLNKLLWIQENKQLQSLL